MMQSGSSLAFGRGTTPSDPFRCWAARFSLRRSSFRALQLVHHPSDGASDGVARSLQPRSRHSQLGEDCLGTGAGSDGVWPDDLCAMKTGTGRAHMLWLIGYYFVFTVGAAAVAGRSVDCEQAGSAALGRGDDWRVDDVDGERQSPGWCAGELLDELA